MLAAPRARNSWLLSIVSRRFSAKARPVEHVVAVGHGSDSEGGR